MVLYLDCCMGLNQASLRVIIPCFFLCVCCRMRDRNTGMRERGRERETITSERISERDASRPEWISERASAYTWPVWHALLFLLFQSNRCDHKIYWIQPLRCCSMTAGKYKRKRKLQMSGSEYGRCALLLVLIWNAKGVCVFLQPWDGTFTFRQKLSKIYLRSNQQLENLLTHK